MKIHEIQDWDAQTEAFVETARDYFRQGYNCSQAVAMTFSPAYGIPTATMARLAASFGGGIGRMRETCGAACGMFLLAGLEVTDPHDIPSAEAAYPDAALKKQNYEVVQHLAAAFRSQTGSLLCRELLGLTPAGAAPLPAGSLTPQPEARTQAYYQKRPCISMVETAVRVYMAYLKEKYTQQKP